MGTKKTSLKHLDPNLEGLYDAVYQAVDSLHMALEDKATTARVSNAVEEARIRVCDEVDLLVRAAGYLPTGDEN